MKINAIALFAFVLACSACLVAPASAPAQTTVAKVAVVNPARVFQEIREFQDLKAAMEAKQKQLQNQQYEKQDAIKTAKAALDSIKPDAPQYAERTRDLIQKSIELEAWTRIQQMEVQTDQKRQMLSLFVKIRAATQEVAASKGIDIVIAEQRPEFEQVNLDQLNVEQLRGLINSQNILFKTPQTDISDEVIANMDAKYKAGK